MVNNRARRLALFKFYDILSKCIQGHTDLSDRVSKCILGDTFYEGAYFVVSWQC